MKNIFFMGIVLVVPLALVNGLLYSVGRFLWTMYQDMLLYRELDQIEAEVASRRESKTQGNQKRLDNGCEHTFGSAYGFPPGVCPKCGLAEVRSIGKCDHVWRRLEGPVVGSTCEICGKEYRQNDDD